MKKVATFLFKYILSSFTFLFFIRLINLGNDLLFEQILISGFLAHLFVTLFQFKINFLTYDLKKSLRNSLIGFMIYVLVALFTILNIDRSRSFYVLSWVDKGALICSNSSLDLSKVRSKEKLNPTGISSRLEEQVKRGLILKSDSVCQLTQYGELYLFSAEVIAKIFKLRNWELNAS